MKSTVALVALVALLVGVALADIRVNQWVDSVFNNTRSAVSKRGLEPMNMAPFKFVIPKTGITNRDVQANFTRGALNGLSRLQRNGDCKNGTQGGDTVIGCNVILSPIGVQMNAYVTGDEISRIIKHINTRSNVTTSTHALIEFRGKRSGASRFVYKTSITVKAMNFTSQLTGPTKLSLNTARMNSFFAAMNKTISLQVNKALTSNYQVVLNDAAKAKAMP